MKLNTIRYGFIGRLNMPVCLYLAESTGAAICPSSSRPQHHTTLLDIEA